MLPRAAPDNLSSTLRNPECTLCEARTERKQTENVGRDRERNDPRLRDSLRPESHRLRSRSAIARQLPVSVILTSTDQSSEMTLLCFHALRHDLRPFFLECQLPFVSGAESEKHDSEIQTGGAQEYPDRPRSGQCPPTVVRKRGSGSRSTPTTEILGCGVQLFTLNRRAAMDLGYKYHQISNANLGNQNPGLDSHMVFVGFSLLR